MILYQDLDQQDQEGADKSGGQCSPGGFQMFLPDKNEKKQQIGNDGQAEEFCQYPRTDHFFEVGSETPCLPEKEEYYQEGQGRQQYTGQKTKPGAIDL